jgi:hypothetical protein
MSASPPSRAAVIGCGANAYERSASMAAAPSAHLGALCDRAPALARTATTNLRDRILRDGPMPSAAGMVEAVHQALLAGNPPSIRPDDMLASTRPFDRVIALGEWS